MGMQNVNPAHKIWHIIGESVRGASHQQSDLPNQDAIKFKEIPEYQAAILAISDGHGSKEYFRSDIGSKYAVEVAVAEIEDVVSIAVGKDKSEVPQLVKQLPQRIVEKWREKVEAHLAETPFFSKKEWQYFNNGKSLPNVTKKPIVPYGATLLAVVVAETFMYCLQLGDGDIVFVKNTGKPLNPLEADKRLLANQTTSLCTDTAVQDFRGRFYHLEQAPPALITLSTDGYANSFAKYEGFLEVSADILKELRQENGLNVVEKDLPGWLVSATNKGSGDDITFGAICHLPALQPPFPQEPEPEIQQPPVSLVSTASTQETQEQSTPRKQFQGLPGGSALNVDNNAPTVYAESDREPKVVPQVPTPHSSGSWEYTEAVPSNPPIQPGKQEDLARTGQSLTVSQQRGKGDCRKINEALRMSQGSVTIYIEAGTYSEQLDLRKDVRLVALGEVIIEGSVPTIYIQKGEVIIEGMKVRGKVPKQDRSKERRAAIEVIGSKGYLRDCDVISDSQLGIYVTGEQARLNLEHCNIAGVRGNAVLVTNKATTNIIKHCTIDDNDRSGICVENASVKIENSYVRENHMDGVELHERANCIINDSFILDNKRFGLLGRDNSQFYTQNSIIDARKESPAVSLEQRSHGTIKQCTVKGKIGRGVEIGEASRVFLQDSTIEVQGKHSALLFTTYSQGNQIDHCTISSSKGNGVLVQSKSEVTMRNNTTISTQEGPYALILIESGGTFTNCKVESPKKGVLVSSSSQASFERCAIESREAWLDARAGSGVTASGCLIPNAQKYDNDGTTTVNVRPD